MEEERLKLLFCIYKISDICILYVRTAVSRIKSHNSSTPLFLYVAYQAPHGPIMEPPATYLNMYSSPQYNSVRRRGAVNRHATISVRREEHFFQLLMGLVFQR